jgi:hypothetical protein
LWRERARRAAADEEETRETQYCGAHRWHIVARGALARPILGEIAR